MFNSKKPDAKEVGKQARKDIDHSKRDLDREIRNLDREEAKAIAEAQRMTKAGNTQGARLMAKEVVRIRNAKTNLQKGKSQLSSVRIAMACWGLLLSFCLQVSLKTKEMESTVVMAKAMQTGAKAMAQSAIVSTAWVYRCRRFVLTPSCLAHAQAMRKCRLRKWRRSCASLRSNRASRR